MKKNIITAIALLFTSYAFGQNKPVIGVTFKGNDSTTYQSAIQNTVEDAFLRTKRFDLVERGEMENVKGQASESASITAMKELKAQYLLIGNVVSVTEDQKQARVPVLGTTVTPQAEIIFNVKVLDVNTGDLVASGNFNNIGKGKNAFNDALMGTRNRLDKFIKDNFKLTATIASVEEKNTYGDASKVLLTAGNAVDLREGDEFKVYENVEVNVEGRKINRKRTIGKIVVSRIEDEHFSVCAVVEGAGEITKLLNSNATLRCELTAEAPKKLFFQK
ncbi:Curli production assembly/transport component CsgG [Chitinophaga jiangningensis]|uniref:Curli production assembly/transport component CsgG n=1 Tax=Chitinophaga jiangningensis TaxID=1419482 RepID=A0A1M6VPE9_9BACT|nr:CsgG/HfaB family protein [Chitinophaga jiangningensis]SHK83329.1 Curli production assembly/transport component CsgG [Chitinophaga jiangningensis]